MKSIPFCLRSLLAFVCLASFSLQVRGEDSDPPLQFNADVLPILAENCFACHGFDEASREADLRLDTEAGSQDVIVVGDPSASSLIHRVETSDPDEIMPPPSSGKKLTDRQREILRQWVRQGAKYEGHWSFSKPVFRTPPTVEEVTHPIDRFVQSKLRDAGLQPSPLAAPETLIRRASLDLIGLPPSTKEVDDFLIAYAKDPDVAWQNLIDRLLSDPHYGERWGRWWLDQARYADSNGYSIDSPRSIWAYRDWVVDALNNDMPFDQFTIEQLAGDLLPEARLDQRIATGFHRNTQINQEGGIDKEQFRIDSVFDRVATTGTVWLGLTVGCAQCHDHKFDPIAQKEFYQLFAFFNNQDEPTIKVHDPALGDPPKDAPTTMVLSERQTPRKTSVYIKGDFTRPAEEVTPGTPAILHPLDQNSGSVNRLDLAKWITSPDNPLTARVIVNRIWQQYFGVGLVSTENDFGLLGARPTHPQLLDWLAIELERRDWSLKDLHRLITSSHTYRQSSHQRDDLDQVDADNRLLGRQVRLRLDAEVIRDVALTASGLMAAKFGGAPVYPPIPAGVMGQGQVKRAWNVSSGENRYRRGFYTFVFRGTPPPSLKVFDAPDGFSSCTRRGRSNTPLQSLTLMNDPAFFEFAETLADVIEQEGVAVAFRRCTARFPDSEELTVLRGLDSITAARVLISLDETITRE